MHRVGVSAIAGLSCISWRQRITVAQWLSNDQSHHSHYKLLSTIEILRWIPRVTISGAFSRSDSSGQLNVRPYTCPLSACNGKMDGDRGYVMWFHRVCVQAKSFQSVCNMMILRNIKCRASDRQNSFGRVLSWNRFVVVCAISGTQRDYIYSRPCWNRLVVCPFAIICNFCMYMYVCIAYVSGKKGQFCRLLKSYIDARVSIIFSIAESFNSEEQRVLSYCCIVHLCRMNENSTYHKRIGMLALV